MNPNDKRYRADTNDYKRKMVIEAYKEVLSSLQKATIDGKEVNLSPKISRADIYQMVLEKVGFYGSIQTISRIVRDYLSEQSA